MVAQFSDGSEEFSWYTLEDIKTFFRNLRPGDINNDIWFLKLLNFALCNYQTKVTAEYFQMKYHDLPPDAIVDQRIALAREYAGMAGAATGLALLGAYAIRASSPVALPAAITTVVADVGYISLLQLYLAYDISVIYGYPLDYQDPEDLRDLLIIAFGVAAGQALNKGLQKYAPKFTEYFIKKTVKGERLQAIKDFPVVGKSLSQRNFIKVGKPVVSILLGAGANLFVTDLVGKRARTIFRRRAAIEEAVRDFSIDEVQNMRLLLDLILLAIYADKVITRSEARFLQAFITRIQEKGSISDLESFSKQINFDKGKILNQLSVCSIEERHTLLNAVRIAVVVDGTLKDTELAFVREAAHRADVTLDEKALRELVTKFR